MRTRPATNRWLSLLPAAVFISNELIRTYVRPVYGRRQYGLLSTVLGWLPNFLAAFGFMALGLAVMRLVLHQYPATVRYRGWVLAGLVVVCLAGFGQHEFAQQGTGLYYDLNDLYATAAGTALGAALYFGVLL